ncbi:MAG TPA: ATP-dependent protease ATPase subunit HslU [Chthonomonadaceae bacterium]|nr:ATP-dependent protease ATPase subunit HslU [Chthonomonadaceae bacterium]
MAEITEDLTPSQIVAELDKYIVGQKNAKRAVAIALRNRYRRRLLAEDLRDEVIPKNILMIGPTGVGKTEIARRLAHLARAPFVKVEATKFTEVGYVGRDVDSMVRDLVQVAIRLVESEKIAEVQQAAEARAIERIVDLLQPARPAGSGRRRAGEEGSGEGPDLTRAIRQMIGPFLSGSPPETASTFEPHAPRGESQAEQEEAEEEARKDAARRERIRERLRQQVASGVRDGEKIEITVEESQGVPFMQVFTPQGMEEMGMDMQSALGGMFPKRHKQRAVTIGEAKQIFVQEEAQALIDRDALVREAIERAEQSGIIFVDEIDKIAGPSRGSGSGSGPDVSREGVQRDILPIIEGSTVMTKYGPVRTDHVLFIAAGAFHVSKPSDLIPELQGRLPIRVELEALTEADFERILTEPRNALTRQYVALLGTEGVTIEFTEEAIRELARVAAEVNRRSENIGARRLHTVLERLLEEVSFEAPDMAEKTVRIDAEYVRGRLEDIVKDEDLSRYIL